MELIPIICPVVSMFASMHDSEFVQRRDIVTTMKIETSSLPFLVSFNSQIEDVSDSSASATRYKYSPFSSIPGGMNPPAKYLPPKIA